MTVYFETHDIARLAGVTPNAVRKWLVTGKLTAVARTQRGVQLFDPIEVERVIRLRKAAAA
jgi:hypothetical protein